MKRVVRAEPEKGDVGVAGRCVAFCGNTPLRFAVIPPLSFPVQQRNALPLGGETFVKERLLFGTVVRERYLNDTTPAPDTNSPPQTSAALPPSP